MKLKDQRRSGIRKNVTIRPTPRICRLTIPAREALEATGAEIVAVPVAEMSVKAGIPPGEAASLGFPLYEVRLGATVPKGLVAVATFTRIGTGAQHSVLGLRLDEDPPYPGEETASYWDRLNYAPCPKCQAPLIRYEAGYVPGYRICAKPPHHHWLAE